MRNYLIFNIFSFLLALIFYLGLVNAYMYNEGQENGAVSNVAVGSLINSMSTSHSTYNINSNSIWHGHTFYIESDKNLSSISHLIRTKVGSPLATDILVQVYSLNELGNPSTLLCSTDLDSNPVASSTNYVPSTFDTPCELEGGNYYSFFVRNINIAPTTNYVGMGYISSIVRLFDGQQNYMRDNRIYSTTNGTSFPKSTYGADYLLNFTDGTYEGFPMVSWGISSGQAGIVWTSPNQKICIKSIGIDLSRAGTYTSIAKLVIYDEFNNEIARSLNNISFSALATSPQVISFFFDNVCLDANRKYFFVREYISSSGGMTVSAKQIFNTGNKTENAKLCNMYGSNSFVHGSKGSYYDAGDYYSNYCSYISIYGKLDRPFGEKMRWSWN